MKKIIVIIISIIAIILIALGVFLSMNSNKTETHPSVDQKILDEREKNDQLDVTTNEVMFTNIDDAISYLTGLYEGGTAAIESNYENYSVISVTTQDEGIITYRYYFDTYVLIQE